MTRIDIGAPSLDVLHQKAPLDIEVVGQLAVDGADTDPEAAGMLGGRQRERLVVAVVPPSPLPISSIATPIQLASRA